MKDRGYIQVYTGDGKGKTTAALGLSLRAVGAGYRVFIGQFVKGMKYSETRAISKYLSDNIKIEQYGTGCFITDEPSEEDIRKAQKGLRRIKEIILEDNFDVIILDEATIAIYFDLFKTEDLIELLKLKKKNQEIIVTGRKAPEKLREFADLVTEMNEVKHYYSRGVEARRGIES
ncbi:MAG: cob(I)yrinic acid a,c-diamide adenosyltransferase [Candidatus Mcinerneyibacterium aminivorans]|jgi:cob(I)alamin adenosyltransferase|uniref:Cob(I)yrinic acid a,c-diamide adenosyltransferase n=1 Tax=Candidatus Mcinerneyibacterium aminivorans TaxID=2703815 RepID=A0A5D0MHY6_9BACT|nr:MAG: cob(I)yrinic acid a,c-diamide adenosyltransferase [Candidatus Mcinerneyibacterium aminivorans]